MSTNDRNTTSIGISETKEGLEGSSQQYDDRHHADQAGLRDPSAADADHKKNVAWLEKPLAGKPHNVLRRLGREYAIKHQLGDEEDVRAFELGACLAQDPSKYSKVAGLRPDELEALEKEVTHRWSQPRLMYVVIVLCSVCAAVQGMDETVVNGAQLFYRYQFGIGVKDEPRSTWLTGLLNSAPYLCCAFIGCWLTVPFNNVFGRRGTIFITCCFSALACFWQAFTNTWWHMFISRFFLGFGIGPKSATVPIFAAECSPPGIRGALVMQWQMWTAFGIMVGYISDLAFYKVQDTPSVVGLNWRLMMGSAMVPAVVVCAFVFMCPESPRWYMSKGRHYKAYESMHRLRFKKVQAARDVFYMYTLLEAEKFICVGKNKVKELVTVRRNRNALVASEIVMFMQQFCGVNIIAYYSSQIFLDGGFSPVSALSASLGFGIINWLFAIPAIYTIDTFGRRNLLITTYPLMSLFLFFTGFSFWIPDESHHTARVACIALGIYLFGMVYSPGEGPVPFTYSAEAYPLYVRSYGMSLATATTWFFNFILSITWPSMQTAFTTQGGFSWYATWNIIGWVAVLLFMPETKGKTLEELDRVFDIPSHKHAVYGVTQLVNIGRRYLLFQRKVQPGKIYEMQTQRTGGEKGFGRESEEEERGYD